MTEIRITIDDAAALAALKRTKEGLLDLRPAMKNIGEYMVLQTDDRFKDQTAPDGSPWQPISRSWRRYKQRKGYIPKILQMRGRLRKSIVYKADADRVSVGSNVVYANIHQLGWRKKNIAARPFLGANEENEREIGRIVADSINDGFQGS